MKQYFYKIEPEDEESRLDKWISDSIPELSRSYIQKLIKDKLVFVNGKPEKASYRLNYDDEILFEIPDLVEPEILPEAMQLDILYEDTDLLIVNKPKDMVVHPAPGHYEHTLVNGIMYHCQDNLSGINGVLRPGIVHRIDKDTTGSIIICKNDLSHKSIAEQLKVHSITRKYQAICYGEFKETYGTVVGKIGRDPKDRKKMAIHVSNGKDATTHYTVLKSKNGFSYIECVLETGRTHQIRVHMSSINHPLLGDAIYGKEDKHFKNLQGQTLHAKVIGFTHPRTNEYMEIDSPLPDYFIALLNQLDLNP